MPKQKLALVIWLMSCLAIAAFFYLDWRQGVLHKNWQSGRVDQVTRIGRSLLQYADSHSGIFPETLDDLVSEGLLDACPAEFHDPQWNVSVRQYYRPVTDPDAPPNTLVLVESYQPPNKHNECIVLSRDGTVSVVRDPGDRLAQKNLEGNLPPARQKH